MTNPAVFCGLCAMINHFTSIIYSTVTCICYESKLTILVGLPDLRNLLVGTGAQDFNEALYICSCFTDSTVQSFGIIKSLYEREEKSVYKKRRRTEGGDKDKKEKKGREEEVEEGGGREEEEEEMEEGGGEGRRGGGGGRRRTKS